MSAFDAAYQLAVHTQSLGAMLLDALFNICQLIALFEQGSLMGEKAMGGQSCFQLFGKGLLQHYQVKGVRNLKQGIEKSFIHNFPIFALGAALHWIVIPGFGNIIELVGEQVADIGLVGGIVYCLFK